MSSSDEIKAVVADHGQLAALNTQQAAALLQTTASALEKAREKSRRGGGGYGMLPSHTDGNTVRYYLTDLIEFRFRSSPHPLPFFMRTLAIMLGPDFSRSVGVPYPLAGPVVGTAVSMAGPPSLATVFGLNPNSTADANELEQVPEADSGDAEKPKRRGPKSKKADNIAMLAAQKAGLTVRRNVLGFASLHDFMLNAEPDDLWLFACPDDGRPYDAIAAILAGPGEVRFEWLTLTDYLHRVSDGAARDKETRASDEQSDQIAAVTKAGKKAKPRSIDG